MNICIVSLKYAPGLTKEFTLIGDRLADAGYDVSYVLARGYEPAMQGRHCSYLTDSVSVKSVAVDTLCYSFFAKARLRRSLRSAVPDVVFVYNQHPLNKDLLKQVKKINARSKSVMYVHEPGKPGKSSYGLKGILVYRYLELILADTLKLCSDIVLPSKYAIEIFNASYGDFAGDVHLCPLLVPDNPGKTVERSHFAMVGRFNYTKPVRPLIELANHCGVNGLGYGFAIVTASDVRSDMAGLSEAAVDSVELINPESLSDKVINDTLAVSKAVFCLHDNVVQSGVVPTAFMNSTPVIVRDTPGFTQHVSHKYNGYVVPNDFSCSDLVDAMDYVSENFMELSGNARRTYDEMFSIWNWDKYYYWL